MRPTTAHIDTRIFSLVITAVMLVAAARRLPASCAFVGCRSGRPALLHAPPRQRGPPLQPSRLLTTNLLNANTAPLRKRGGPLLLAGRAATTKTKTKTKSKSKPSSKARPYKLVIVESPSKASTISAILNRHASAHQFPYAYVVDSCRGHVRDLPRSAKEVDKTTSKATTAKEKKGSRVLGVDVGNGYAPQYIIPSDKIATVTNLRSLAEGDNGCVGVILATDEDREGEAIAWHLAELLRGDSSGKGEEGEVGGGGGAFLTRVTFNEITEAAVSRAFFGEQRPGETAGGGASPAPSSEPAEAGHAIDMDLVAAQETRRVLDRLAGYTVSPLLWRKIAPGLSAGRVQSVGLKLVVDRERERLRHKSAEYWDARAVLGAGADGGGGGGGAPEEGSFNATLVAVGGVRVASGRDFGGETGRLAADLREGRDVVHLPGETARRLFDGAAAAGTAAAAATWTVTSVDSKSRRNAGPAPFITSTLQQDSNRRLGLSVSDTMRAAQMLYEGGYISYMRTDSTHLSDDALEAGGGAVVEEYGAEYLAEEDPNARAASKRKKSKKKQDASSKNAQEAHEAIRPAIQEGGRFLAPREVPAHYKAKSGGALLPERTLKLYGLIYSRTTASFMKEQVLEQTSVVVDRADGDFTATFRASGSVVVFPGYALAYGGGGGDSLLPPLSEGQVLDCSAVEPLEHHTKPPPRYNEASFVKELEALGVGRPSTYASVVQTLRQRAYIGTPLKGDESVRSKPSAATGAARIAQRAAGGDEFMGSGRGPLCPSLSAFVVCTLLEKHFPSYVDPTFTADMEDKLDNIANGNKEETTRFQYLDDYWGGEDGLAAQVDRVDKVIDASEARRADLPGLLTQNDDVGLFIGPWGAYVQRTGSLSSSDGEKPPTANLPQGMAADLSTITLDVLNTLLAAKEKDGILIGAHPKDGRSIRLKIGR